MQLLEENREYSIAETKYKTDESKRLGMPKTHSDLFGMVVEEDQLDGVDLLGEEDKVDEEGQGVSVL